MIGGIYDLEKQLEFECLRGVEEISCLRRLFGQTKEERQIFCPYSQMADALTSMASNTLIHHLPQSWLFFHNQSDELVPFGQCSNFFDQIEETGILNISLKSFTSSDHCQVVYNLLLGDVEDFESELALLKERKSHIARYRRWMASEHNNPSRRAFAAEYRSTPSSSSTIMSRDVTLR